MFRKILPIVGICMVILGGILTAFFWKPMMRETSASENYVEKQCAYTVEETKSLMISGSTGKIEVTAYDGDEILLNWYEGEHTGWDVSMRDGVLTATYKVRTGWLSLGFLYEEYDGLRVSMPRDCVKDAEISASTGDILCSDVRFGNVSASCSTGKIAMRNSEVSGDITLSASTGTIEADGLRGAGNGAISVSTGDVTLRNTEIAGRVVTTATTGKLTAEHVQMGEVRASCSTGDMCWKDATVESMKIKSTTGDIVLEGLSAKNAEIGTTTGSIRGTMAHPVTEYDIVSETTTGDNNLPTISLGTRKLHVETTTGDIQVEFAK